MEMEDYERIICIGFMLWQMIVRLLRMLVGVKLKSMRKRQNRLVAPFRFVIRLVWVNAAGNPPPSSPGIFTAGKCRWESAENQNFRLLSRWSSESVALT